MSTPKPISAPATPPSPTPSPSPSDLYIQTLSSLHNAQSNMLRAAFQLALKSQTVDMQQQAQKAFLDLTTQISTLEDATLSKIAAQMVAQEKDLTAANTTLTAALADLTKVATIIGAINKAIGVIAKIIPIAASVL